MKPTSRRALRSSCDADLAAREVADDGSASELRTYVATCSLLLFQTCLRLDTSQLSLATRDTLRSRADIVSKAPLRSWDMICCAPSGSSLHLVLYCLLGRSMASRMERHDGQPASRSELLRRLHQYCNCCSIICSSFARFSPDQKVRLVLEHCDCSNGVALGVGNRSSKKK